MALLVVLPLLALPASFFGGAEAFDQIARTLLPRALGNSLLLCIGVGVGTLVVGGGIFLYLLLIGGPWFLAALATLAIVALVGLVQYLSWGRAFPQQVDGSTQGAAGGPRVNGRAISGRVLPGRGAERL